MKLRTWHWTPLVVAPTLLLWLATAGGHGRSIGVRLVLAVLPMVSVGVVHLLRCRFDTEFIRRRQAARAAKAAPLTAEKALKGYPTWW